jgi:hypothetical protein
MARVLALCLDWRSSVPELSNSSTKNAAQSVSPPQNAILEGISTLKVYDQHSTALLENVPAQISQPQVLVSPLPKPQDQPTESSATNKMNLTLPYNGLVALPSPPRSKVLLVEDNAINMKVRPQNLRGCASVDTS